MPRTPHTILALTVLSVAGSLCAQQAPAPAFSAEAASAGSGYSETYTQPAAPIERKQAGVSGSYAPENGYGAGSGYAPQAPSPQAAYSQPARPPLQTHTSQPAEGIWLVTAPDASVQTVSVTPDHVELRVEHGRANVNIDHPADDSEILVDLPGGQVALLKDGLYTFNADTNTVRVLRGEAEVELSGDKPVKLKEEHQLVLAGNAHPREADRVELRADLLQGNYEAEGSYRHGDGYGYREGFYGGPYAYGWPYYGFYGPGWGYPYYGFSPWGYPYGYGVGLRFGYYGGFRGGYGGFRGGYGGFRGGFRR